MWQTWASSSKPHSDPLHYSNSIPIRPCNKSPGEPLNVTCCSHQIESHTSENGTYSCSTMAAKPDRDAHTERHTLRQQQCKVHDVNSVKKRAQTYKPIPLHTCLHSEPSHAFLFWIKEGTCPYNHATDDNKDTTERREERLPCAFTKLPFWTCFPFFSFSRAKCLCASKECEHQASVEIAKTAED